MYQQRLATFFCTFAVTACSIISNDSQLSRSEVPSSHLDYAILGQAFHTHKKKILNTVCVEGTLDETQGNTEANFDLKTDLTWSQVLDRLGGTLSVGVNFPVVRAGASANYAKELAASNLSTTYNYNWTHTPKKRIFRPGSYRLTQTGQDIAQRPADIFEKCGDEFINAIEYGASLNVNMKIEFLNELDKLKVGGMLKVDVGRIVDIVKVEGNLNYLDEKAKKSIRITIQARQQGGDPTKLTRIIPNNLFSCDLSNPEPCLKLFDEAIKYSKNDLPTQLSNLNQYNVIKYVTESYDESLIQRLVPAAGYPVVRSEVETLRQKLEDAYQQAAVDQLQASRLITTYKELLTPEEYQGISKIESMAKENLRIYESASRACFDNPYDSCIQVAEAAFSKAKQYDNKVMSIRRAPLPLSDEEKKARQDLAQETQKTTGMLQKMNAAVSQLSESEDPNFFYGLSILRGREKEYAEILGICNARGNDSCLDLIKKIRYKYSRFDTVDEALIEKMIKRQPHAFPAYTDPTPDFV